MQLEREAKHYKIKLEMSVCCGRQVRMIVIVCAVVRIQRKNDTVRISNGRMREVTMRQARSKLNDHREKTK